MALIECPECKKRISSLAEACPNYGLPRNYFSCGTEKEDDESIALENFPNILKSFEFDYNNILSKNEYIAKGTEIFLGKFGLNIKENFGRYFQIIILTQFISL